MLREDHAESSDESEESRSNEEAESNRVILCRVCESEVSSHDQIIVMSTTGASQAFANPSGLLREVLTLAHAWNLEIDPQSTTDFTWYPGYAWRICYCAQCHSHLGWQYEAVESREPNRFYGLLLKAIRRS